MPLSKVAAGSKHQGVSIKMLSVFLVAHASVSLYAFSQSLLKWGVSVNDSLVVKHHIRQPDVFWGQPDLHHSIKLLRDPSQTIVLPLLRANRNTMLSHSFANHTAVWRHLKRAGRGRPVVSSVCESVSRCLIWNCRNHVSQGNILCCLSVCVLNNLLKALSHEPISRNEKESMEQEGCFCVCTFVHQQIACPLYNPLYNSRSVWLVYVIAIYVCSNCDALWLLQFVLAKVSCPWLAYLPKARDP